MIQRVVKIGNTFAVTLPKKTLKELGVKTGGQVALRVERGEVTVFPSKKLSSHQQKIAELTLNFINRYRKDLEALAHK